MIALKYLGDLKNLIDDMTTGLENISSEGTVYNLLKRFNEKTGLKRLREGSRTLYSAEDDFYKIQNFFADILMFHFHVSLLFRYYVFQNRNTVETYE